MNPQAKLKSMEKAYNKNRKQRKMMNSQEAFNPSISQRPNTNASGSRSGLRGMRRSQNDSLIRNRKPNVGPPRETIISYTNDPGVIHRGEILPFETLKKNEMAGNTGPRAPEIGASSPSHSGSGSAMKSRGRSP